MISERASVAKSVGNWKRRRLQRLCREFCKKKASDERVHFTRLASDIMRKRKASECKQNKITLFISDFSGTVNTLHFSS